MNEFVNVELGVYNLLKNAGYNPVLVVPERVSEPVIWIMKTGGVRTGVNEMTRLQICSIDSNRSKSVETANEVLNLLLDSPHFVPGIGLLDYVRCESTPVEVPFKDSFRNTLFTIAVETRAI